MENEKVFRRYTIAGIERVGGHAQHHEDKIYGGVPDLSYGIRGNNGWLEAKWREDWPKRNDTIVRFPHFTAQQRKWIFDRGKIAGHCFIWINIADEFFLFNWRFAFVVGNMTRAEMLNRNNGYWSGEVDWQELCCIIE
jgi:hypothetical protein